MKNTGLFIKSTRFFFLLASIWMLYACQEMNIDSQGEFSSSVKTDLLKAYTVDASNPQTIQFNINSNTPWEVVTDEQWCHVSPSMSGSSSLIEEITITMDENTSLEPRTATVKVIGIGIETPIAESTITQSAKSNFHIQTGSTLIPADGGNISFTITSNKPWSIQADKQWLTLDKMNGEAGENIDITATALQNTGAQRSATVTVIVDGEEKTVQIDQDGLVLKFNITDDSQLDTKPGGDTKEFDIVSSLSNWEVTCDIPGIEITPSLADNKVTVKVPANHLFTERKIALKLSPVPAIADMESSVIELTQPTNFTPLGVPQLYEFNNEDGSVKLLKGGNGATTNVYLTTKDTYKYGTFTWEFSDIAIAAPFYFMVEGKCANAPALSLKVMFPENANNGIALTTGGTLPDGTSFWKAKQNLKAYGYDELSGMQTLQMVIKKGASKTLSLEFYLNGSLIGKDDTRIDPWETDNTTEAFSYNFGIYALQNGTASMRVKSFKFEPLN